MRQREADHVHPEGRGRRRNHLILAFPASRPVRRYVSVALAHKSVVLWNNTCSSLIYIWSCVKSLFCICGGDRMIYPFSSINCCSVEKSCLRPQGLQHSRLPYPPPPPRFCSNAYLLCRWCHPTISLSVGPFSCPQSFPASESFPMSQFSASGGQSIGVSASASVLPMNIQDWFLSGWTGLILLSIVRCINIFPTNRHPCTLEWVSLTSFVLFGAWHIGGKILVPRPGIEIQGLAVRAES